MSYNMVGLINFGIKIVVHVNTKYSAANQNKQTSPETATTTKEKR